MKFKKFEFPTFNEWNERDDKGYIRNYETNIGDFYLHIRPLIWDSDYISYKLAIACRQNPLNMYSETIVSYNYRYENNDPNNLTNLEDWYNKVTERANEEFEKYMVEAYCE